MSPVLREVRKPSYTALLASTVLPHSSILASEAKKASFATFSAVLTAPIARLIAPSFGMFSPSLPVRSFTAVLREVVCCLLSPILEFISLSEALPSLIL